jgi:Spy/CpxP family protein refolding chaperone
LRNATDEERQKAAAEARERREKTNTAILAVLKPEQKESFEKLQGTKFTFPERTGRRGNN